ncbi:phenylacetate--CoA ligase family protein [Roseateles sp. BYS180W]|uniref:Phenylacetate--CoA ligase family protein n=1 Tax=Roseateles rivi TaxID=3299028 RepID=A0ABW7FTZ3_9BURK
MNMPDLLDPVSAIARLLARRQRLATEVLQHMNLGPAALLDWQQTLLRATVQHALLHSPHYRRTLQGVGQAWLQGLCEFSELPLTTREQLMDAYPFGMLATAHEELVRFGESSGTSTGRSLAAYFTADDWFTNNCAVAHHLQQVLSPQDVVAVAVPYELAGVGQDLDRALELVGCTVVALGAVTPFCPSERMVQILRDARVTALVCSGTRALHLAEVAQAQGLNPAQDLGLRKLLCAGEGASAAKRELLERTWNARVYPMYGMTETNTLAMCCPAQQLHLMQSRHFFEVLDPDSGLPVGEGQAGELVVSTLAARALPLLRYRTGDLVRLHSAPCRCGRPTQRIDHLGRLGDVLHVGTQRISLLALEQTLLSCLDCAPYHYAVKPLQGTLLQVGLTDNNLVTAVQARLRQAFEHQHGLTLEFVTIDRSKVDQAVRQAVKPTMKSIYLD